LLNGTLKQLRLDANNPASWRALELLAEVPASRLGCHHPIDVSVFLRNLIPLVKVEDLDPTSDNYFAGPLQRLVEKGEVDLCQTIARRVDQDRIINILLELSVCQVSPRCPLQSNTVGWALMMNAMQQHILTNSRQYWELSHAHSLKESGEPNHSANRRTHCNSSKSSSSRSSSAKRSSSTTTTSNKTASTTSPPNKTKSS